MSISKPRWNLGNLLQKREKVTKQYNNSKIWKGPKILKLLFLKNWDRRLFKKVTIMMDFTARNVKTGTLSRTEMMWDCISNSTFRRLRTDITRRRETSLEMSGRETRRRKRSTPSRSAKMKMKARKKLKMRWRSRMRVLRWKNKRENEVWNKSLTLQLLAAASK